MSDVTRCTCELQTLAASAVGSCDGGPMGESGITPSSLYASSAHLPAAAAATDATGSIAPASWAARDTRAAADACVVSVE